MAAKDVYRIVTAEGHEYDYHGTVEQLKEAHPGAQITGRRVVSAVGEGSYEPYSMARAQAAQRKESAAKEPAAKVEASEAPAEKVIVKATPAKSDKPAAKDETAP